MATTPKKDAPSASAEAASGTIVAYARNTFDLPKTDDPSRKDRGRQAVAGEPVMLSGAEFEKYQRLGLVEPLKGAPVSLKVNGHKPEGARHVDRFMVSRGGGWYDVADASGRLVAGGPHKGRAAVIELDVTNLYAEPAQG